MPSRVALTYIETPGRGNSFHRDEETHAVPHLAQASVGDSSGSRAISSVAGHLDEPHDPAGQRGHQPRGGDLDPEVRVMGGLVHELGG